MLISSILYVIILLAVVLGFSVLIYYRQKGKKVSGNLQVAWFFLIVILFMGYLLLPRAYIVNDSDYKKRIVIGISSMKLDNGEEVYISDNCAINNSKRPLYVETIRYIYSSGYSGMYSVETIEPYSKYGAKIDYAFKTPPQTIRTNVLVKDSHIKKWLREKSYYE